MVQRQGHSQRCVACQHTAGPQAVNQQAQKGPCGKKDKTWKWPSQSGQARLWRPFKAALETVSLFLCSRRRCQRLRKSRGEAGSDLGFKITPVGGDTEGMKEGRGSDCQQPR